VNRNTINKSFPEQIILFITFRFDLIYNRVTPDTFFWRICIKTNILFVF
jgi:hypothetical protein